MMPPAVSVAPVQQPTPAPVPLLAAGVQPRAAKSFNHVSGSVDGGKTNYSDLHAFSWFFGGGRELRGPRRLSQIRGLSGVEDNEKRKQ